MEIVCRKKYREKLESEERAELKSVVDGQGSKERRRCVLDGLEAEKNRKPRKLDGEGEAKLTMLARSASPDECARWTLNLLGERPGGAGGRGQHLARDRSARL